MHDRTNKIYLAEVKKFLKSLKRIGVYPTTTVMWDRCLADELDRFIADEATETPAPRGLTGLFRRIFKK